MVRPISRLWIYYYDDWELHTYEEIAELTGRSLHTVRGNSFKAKWLVDSETKPDWIPEQQITTEGIQMVDPSVSVIEPTGAPPDVIKHKVQCIYDDVWYHIKEK